MPGIKSSGPTPCDVLFVGEAPGQQESVLGVPFVGDAGQELRAQLAQAGFNAGAKRPLYLDSEVRMTNVFMEQPPKNDLDFFCGKRADVPKAYKHQPLAQGKYVLEKYLHYLDDLRDEIVACNPRLIVALGNVPCWALLNRTGITKLRGAVYPCELVPGVPVLPTFHPSYILRSWQDRVIAVGDLIKAKRFLDEGFNPPRRELWLAPTIAEVQEFCTRFILEASPRPRVLSFDIETFADTITCIGFAPTPELAITIPFFDPAKPDRNYWADPADELAAWRIVYEVLTSDIPKLGQNGLYDIQYLHRHHIRVRHYLHDTMIKHHALYPELPKGLGFMATLYTDEAQWKVLRDRNRDNFKIDDE